MHLLSIRVLIAILIMLCPFSLRAEVRPLPADCTYVLQTWNVNSKASVKSQKVRHPYKELTPAEIEPLTGCTICSEDQETISIPPLPPFSVCFKLAPKIRSLAEYLVKKGEPLQTVVAYHVIKSRGPVDVTGNRTEFSNHSFGTAIDINPELNGLYDNCIKFGPECRLIRGGEWRPGVPGTLEKNGDIVTMFKQAGFLWGGEIAGKQKDFMHFSLTGY